MTHRYGIGSLELLDSGKLLNKKNDKSHRLADIESRDSYEESSDEINKWQISKPGTNQSKKRPKFGKKVDQPKDNKTSSPIKK